MRVLGALEEWHNLLQGQIRALRRSIWVSRRCYSSVRALACETRHSAVEQISAQTEWCDRVRKFERSIIQETVDAIW